jgi:hypothetical protein
MKTHLSDKPSEMIRQALADLRLVEKDERYRISMGDWHSPGLGSRPCFVCLAGAVMAQKISPDVESDPHDFEDYGKLMAIDCFRLGAVAIGLPLVNLNLPESISGDMTVHNYRENPERFYFDMAEMASALEGAGL